MSDVLDGAECVLGEGLDTGYLRFTAVLPIHLNRVEHAGRGHAAADFDYASGSLRPDKTMQELRLDRPKSGAHAPGDDFLELLQPRHLMVVRTADLSEPIHLRGKVPGQSIQRGPSGPEAAIGPEPRIVGHRRVEVLGKDMQTQSVEREKHAVRSFFESLLQHLCEPGFYRSAATGCDVFGIQRLRGTCGSWSRVNRSCKRAEKRWI